MSRASSAAERPKHSAVIPPRRASTTAPSQVRPGAVPKSRRSHSPPPPGASATRHSPSPSVLRSLGSSSSSKASLAAAAGNVRRERPASANRGPQIISGAAALPRVMVNPVPVMSNEYDHSTTGIAAIGDDAVVIGDSGGLQVALLEMQFQQLLLWRSDLAREGRERAERTRSEILRLWRLAAAAEDAGAELEHRRAVCSELVEIHCAIMDAHAKLLSLERLLLSPVLAHEEQEGSTSGSGSYLIAGLSQPQQHCDGGLKELREHVAQALALSAL